jgi:adenine-specific DNA-methyltransferase
VDTRHFSEDFKWRLLAHFDDLDEALDGMLIKSENFQALNLLLEKYRGKVKCIYIDPPYNTGSDEFLYKDRYQHSSWLSMMADRLDKAKELLSEDGAIFIHIDENEQSRLRMLVSTSSRKVGGSRKK